MPLGDYGAYFARLDIGLAIVVAIVGIVVAFAIYVFVQSALDDVLGALPMISARLARANRSRHRAAGPEWVCRDCHSINAPNAIWCYRGCGSRYRKEDGRIDLGSAFSDEPDRGRLDA
jgi:hypothetical protein